MDDWEEKNQLLAVQALKMMLKQFSKSDPITKTWFLVIEEVIIKNGD